MRSTGPEIHAVVEISVTKNGSWVELPLQPWPYFVRLSRATTEDEIALLVGTLSSYGRQQSAARSADELTQTFPQILPGGFAVIGDESTIWPGCCCGLETWPEWLKVLSGGGSPWMGHDPAPLIEVLGGNVHVWPDGALGERADSEPPLVFTREQFDTAVKGAAADLEAFTIPFLAWLEAHAPHRATVLARKFRNAFVSPEI